MLSVAAVPLAAENVLALEEVVELVLFPEGVMLEVDEGVGVVLGGASTVVLGFTPAMVQY